MRLWSIHPKYLDTKGIVALWREALLARKVLQGQTKGYQHHPQLERFKESTAPLEYIECYLYHVFLEAIERGYQFDKTKVKAITKIPQTIEVTTGQLQYEWEHLRQKLQNRAPDQLNQWQDITQPETHPIFHLIPGEIARWERF